MSRIPKMHKYHVDRWFCIYVSNLTTKTNKPVPYGVGEIDGAKRTQWKRDPILTTKVLLRTKLKASKSLQKL